MSSTTIVISIIFGILLFMIIKITELDMRIRKLSEDGVTVTTEHVIDKEAFAKIVEAVTYKLKDMFMQAAKEERKKEEGNDC